MDEELQYCDAIYKRFVERRAHSLLLSVRDWEQILTWRERDIPLGVVLRVIDRNVEASEGEGRPLRLTELGPLVRGAWLDLRKAGVGRPQDQDEDESLFPMSYILASLIEPAAERLRAELRSDATGDAIKEVLGHAIGRLRQRQLSGMTAEQLMGWESRVNRNLLEAAEKIAPPEQLEQARKRAEEAANSTSQRTSAVVQTKLAQLVLRRNLGVPRLRLFTDEGTP